MGKLIYEETREYETVMPHKASPNGVRLAISCTRIRVWRIRLEAGVPRYLIQRDTWHYASGYKGGDEPDRSRAWLVAIHTPESAVLREAIAALDTHVEEDTFAHANMSEHWSYTDAAPAPLAKVECHQ